MFSQILIPSILSLISSCLSHPWGLLMLSYPAPTTIASTPITFLSLSQHAPTPDSRPCSLNVADTTGPWRNIFTWQYAIPYSTPQTCNRIHCRTRIIVALSNGRKQAMRSHAVGSSSWTALSGNCNPSQASPRTNKPESICLAKWHFQSKKAVQVLYELVSDPSAWASLEWFDHLEDATFISWNSVKIRKLPSDFRVVDADGIDF